MKTLNIISTAAMVAIVCRTEQPLSRFFGVLFLLTMLLLAAADDAKKAARKHQKAEALRRQYKNA